MKHLMLKSAEKGRQERLCVLWWLEVLLQLWHSVVVLQKQFYWLVWILQTYFVNLLLPSSQWVQLLAVLFSSTCWTWVGLLICCCCLVLDALRGRKSLASSWVYRVAPGWFTDLLHGISCNTWLEVRGPSFKFFNAPEVTFIFAALGEEAGKGAGGGSFTGQ